MKSVAFYEQGDGFSEVDDDILVKDGDDVIVLRAGNDRALSRVIFNNTRVAQALSEIDVEIPMAPFVDYDPDLLIAAVSDETASVSSKINSICADLDRHAMPMPSLPSIRRVAARLNGSREPDIIHLRFAQWGGFSNNMPDVARGRGGGSHATQSGDMNRFYGMQSSMMFDTMLDFVRGDASQWQHTTEQKLAESEHSGHRGSRKDDENDEYRLSWTERIKKKRLKRLNGMLENKRLREQREKENTPEYIRLNADTNDAAHIPIELRLVNKRDIDEEHYGKKRVLEELVPPWHDRKSVRVPLTPPTWKKRRKSSVDEKMDKAAQVIGTSYTIDSNDRIRPPWRRNPDPGNEYVSNPDDADIGDNVDRASDPSFASFGSEERSEIASIVGEAFEISDVFKGRDEPIMDEQRVTKEKIQFGPRYFDIRDEQGDSGLTMPDLIRSVLSEQPSTVQPDKIFDLLKSFGVEIPLELKLQLTQDDSTVHELSPDPNKGDNEGGTRNVIDRNRDSYHHMRR